MKQIKFLNLALATSLIFSAVPVSANTQYSDSTHEVINVDAPITEDSNSNCDVYAELGSEFKVTIPKKIVLDGALKKGTYKVTVEGDIAGLEVVNVVPDKAVTLSSKDKADVIGTIAQDKIAWTYNEILSDNKVLGNGEIDANKITAGAWNGTFNFNINLSEKIITVTAKNESGEDLNASSNLIEGEERENLLNGLVDAGFVSSADDVDALIDVDSDDFDGLADTTFDVSSIAKEGDTVVIVHFDEEKQMWEHVATETVDSDGTISGNFSSYSPVGFIVIDSEGNQTIHTNHSDNDNDLHCDICNKQGTLAYTYHTHTGTSGNGCYNKPVYHQHTSGCYSKCGRSYYFVRSFTSGGQTWYAYACPNCTTDTSDNSRLICRTAQVGGTCSNSRLTCSRGNNVEGYTLGCGKTTSTIESQYTKFD